VADFAERSGIAASLAEPDELPPLSADAELGLFRSLQEALSNVLRHAAATSVDVAITWNGTSVLLRVADNGRGLPDGPGEAQFERNGHMGLAGMRERITALGGLVRIGRGTQSGAVIEVSLPAPSEQ
jgi:two-component system sensor histidine kinase UhpB